MENGDDNNIKVIGPWDEFATKAQIIGYKVNYLLAFIVICWNFEVVFFLNSFLSYFMKGKSTFPLTIL
jgi:hypothetical protein